MTTALFTKVPRYVFSDEIPWTRPRTTRTKFNTKCPWHGEKKGYALSVDEEKGVYYCHSCASGGKIIDRNTASIAPGYVPPLDRPRTVDDYVQKPDGTWKFQPDVQVTSYNLDINPNIIRNKLNIQETVYGHRLHLPSPRADNCNQYTRVYYNEDHEKEKGVRLLCWLWGCPFCQARLKWLWKQRIERALKDDIWGMQCVVVLPPGEKIEKQMAYFRRWCKTQGIQFDYIHIKGQSYDYLFVAGPASVFIEVEKLHAQFESAKKVHSAVNSDTMNFYLEQALNDVPEYEHGARRIRASRKFTPSKGQASKKEAEKVAAGESGESEAGEVEEKEEKKGQWLTVYGTIEDEAARIETEGKQVVWFGEDYFEVVKKAEPVEKVPAPPPKAAALSFLDELLNI